MGDMTSNWLSQLAPAHAPPPLGFWPLAPGWWILAALLCLLMAAWGGWWHRSHRSVRRLALRELKRIAASSSACEDLACQLENLLRRYALAYYGHARVARLCGQAWLDFLVNHGANHFRGAAGRALLSHVYGGGGPCEREHWLAGARAFVRFRPPRHERHVVVK